jgi:hypothetical protein
MELHNEGKKEIEGERAKDGRSSFFSFSRQIATEAFTRNNTSECRDSPYGIQLICLI